MRNKTGPGNNYLIQKRLSENKNGKLVIMLHGLKKCGVDETCHPQDHGRLPAHMGIHFHYACTLNIEKCEHMWDPLVCVQMHWFWRTRKATTQTRTWMPASCVSFTKQNWFNLSFPAFQGSLFHKSSLEGEEKLNKQRQYAKQESCQLVGAHISSNL